MDAIDESPDTSSTPAEDKLELLRLLKAEVEKGIDAYSASDKVI